METRLLDAYAGANVGSAREILWEGSTSRNINLNYQQVLHFHQKTRSYIFLVGMLAIYLNSVWQISACAGSRDWTRSNDRSVPRVWSANRFTEQCESNSFPSNIVLYVIYQRIIYIKACVFIILGHLKTDDFRLSSR